MKSLKDALDHVLLMAEIYAGQCDLEDANLCRERDPDRWVAIKAVEEWAIEQDILPDPHAAVEEFHSMDRDERPFDLQPPKDDGLGEAETNH